MPQQDTRAGLLYGAGAYTLWGLSPLYWHLLIAVPHWEITVHRVIWCAVAVGIVIAFSGRLANIIESLRSKRLLATLMVTGLLIAFNWGVMVWAAVSEQIVEAAFGYFINPLANIALGVLLLGERLSVLRWVAVALGVAAVVVQTIALGAIPYIALALGLSFSFYGYFRKIANIGGLDGVFVEAMLLLPFGFVLVVYWQASGQAMFLNENPYTDILLVLCGPVTAVPLILFSTAARQVRLSTLGFLQYIGPTIALVVAVYAFGETFTLVHGLTFGCVWSALLLLAFDRERRLKPIPAAPQKS
ncbi:MAG: EamA family transporter RarD [Micropepsaceae bacterium]